MNSRQTVALSVGLATVVCGACLADGPVLLLQKAWNRPPVLSPPEPNTGGIAQGEAPVYVGGGTEAAVIFGADGAIAYVQGPQPAPGNRRTAEVGYGGRAVLTFTGAPPANGISWTWLTARSASAIAIADPQPDASASASVLWPGGAVMVEASVPNSLSIKADVTADPRPFSLREPPEGTLLYTRYGVNPLCTIRGGWNNLGITGSMIHSELETLRGTETITQAGIEAGRLSSIGEFGDIPDPDDFPDRFVTATASGESAAGRWHEAIAVYMHATLIRLH